MKTETELGRIDWRELENRQRGFDLFYRFHCKTEDCSPDIAVERWIADDLGWDFEQRCTMALFHGATYAGPCESMFAHEFPVIGTNMSGPIRFFREHKKRLLFSPDCKYRKIVFPDFLESIGVSIKPYKTLGRYIQASFAGADWKANYRDLKRRCQAQWYHWGRMGHWCFSEALARFVDAPIEPPTMEFSDGASHRAGWAFCIGRDDLTGKKIRKADCAHLEKTAAEYVERVKDRLGKRAGFFTLETACCNYKRQHKGTRYGGCYIDEQHTETMHMQKHWPEYRWLWTKYLEGREAVIPFSLLFELHPEAESETAYLKDWNRSLVDHGRIPRVEAWALGKPQQWKPLKQMEFAA